jgi:cell division protein FtsW
VSRTRAKHQLESNVLVLVALALTAFGLVMVYSATSAPAAVGNGEPIYYLKRQAIYAALGVVALLAFSRIHYRKLKQAAPTALVVSFVLLLGVLAAGQTVNGARRWLAVGPVVFQPSELAKLALAAWAAMYVARRPPARTMSELVKPVGLVTLVFAGVVVVEPDLGTAITMGVMVLGVLLIAGTPIRLLVIAASIATAIGIAAIWLEPYRRVRVFSFLNPWGDAQGAGFQTVQAMIGLGSGGVFGVGLGQGVQKVFYLPEAHTDMIFAIIGEELGLVGAALVVAAFMAFAWAGLSIALRARDPFAKTLAAAVTMLVCSQAAINLAAVVGIAPLTGVPLPLVSYGGSSLIACLASVGILLNIARNGAAAVEAVVPDRGRGDRRPHRAVAGGGRGAARPRRAGELRRYA